MVQVIRLRGDPELRVERPVRFTIPEQVDGEGRAIGQGQNRANVPPDETTGAEAVYEDDRCTPVTIALDVERARADGNAEQVCVDGNVSVWAFSLRNLGTIIASFVQSRRFEQTAGGSTFHVGAGADV
jgi:hypothetical protein